MMSGSRENTQSKYCDIYVPMCSIRTDFAKSANDCSRYKLLIYYKRREVIVANLRAFTISNLLALGAHEFRRTARPLWHELLVVGLLLLRNEAGRSVLTHARVIRPHSRHRVRVHATYMRRNKTERGATLKTEKTKPCESSNKSYTNAIRSYNKVNNIIYT